MGLAADDFIAKWKDNEGGQERANYGMFLTELCQVLGVPSPAPAHATTELNDYVFERAVTFNNRDGSASQGRIDLYKRGCFVLEAKQSRLKGGAKEVAGQDDLFGTGGKAAGRSGRQWDVLMMNARQQAEEYAHHLPPSHEWPPFIVVCDVGHCFELYADFTGKGRNYTQFPDRQGFRIFLNDLYTEEKRQLLGKVWTDPHSLDPAKRAAKATREIAERLAAVSRRLEAKNHPPEEVALFLMRCLFTMFAEDTELIVKGSFTALLERCTANPPAFVPMVTELWKQMNAGGFAVAIEAYVKCFNGKLFADARVFPMGREDIGELKEAAGKDWREVDPSIFGTLLEQALDPAERSRLGAHYTPRAYVERLVIATVIEPLREEWNNVQGSLELDAGEALERVKAFHQKLCETRVLDPACGTGNFLYVTLELMKRLEGEVLDMIERLGGQEALRLERFNVDPHQFLGLEINPRAAAIAELVLWIGYLRWHIKTKGEPPPEPILREFRNIVKKDAVLEHDGVDAKGNYKNPRRPEWPEAEYIVGNPPFLGAKFMREFLGDSYTECLWQLNAHSNDSADFVMYWWDRAAELLARKDTKLRRFGLVTTNSITQVFQRRVVERHLNGKNPVSLLMAIPDHPWTKATKDSAAVRIAMTVVGEKNQAGVLHEVVSESDLDTDDPQIALKDQHGLINPDLTVGVDVTKAVSLQAGEGLCSPGVKLHGFGFIVTPEEAQHLGLGRHKGLEKHIRLYRNGRDLMATPRDVMVIDLFGLEAEEVRARFPEVYQHVLQNVKPERDSNNRNAYKKYWWIFGEPRKDLRPALDGLKRYIVTPVTPKHRVFSFLPIDILPDDALMNFAFDDPAILGFLESRIHEIWVTANASSLGMYKGDIRYIKSRCFDPFPFPDADAAMRVKIAGLAESIDRHRKEAQAAHPQITLTQMYNVLEKVRAQSSPSPLAGEGGSRRLTGEGAGSGDSAEGPLIRRFAPPSPARGEGELNDNERRVFDEGLILILKELHDELDAAVAEAYGWPADLSDDEILARLVALNKERAAEEARGVVRWLRPDYQIPRFGTPAEKAEQIEADLAIAPVAKTKASFPQGAVEQTAAVMAALAGATAPLSAGDIAGHFKQGRKAETRVAATLASLARTGFISASGNGRYTLRRAA